MKYCKILFPVFLAFFMLSFTSGQELVKGAVVANWNFTLKPGVAADRFEKFMIEQYIPAFEKSYEGVRMTLLKGERGVKKDGYCILLHFKSMSVRNEWWPQEGIASDKVKKALEEMKTVEDRMNTMIDWASFTDWIVL
jgi:hypothetical protein